MRTPVSIVAAALVLLAGPIPPAHAGDPVPVRLNQAKLLASLGAAGDVLGRAVAVSGGIVVVGAQLDDDNGTDSGSAWIYGEPAGGWDGTLVEIARLVPSGAGIEDFFGRSVAVEGGVVVVGAWGSDDNGSLSGAVYVFVEPPGGWSGLVVEESAKLLASDGAAFDLFGGAVAISGGTIVVGADSDDNDNGSDSGAVYVFTEPPGGWAGVLEEDAKLLPTDGAEEDNFGLSVAVSGGTVVAGAPFHDDVGAAYVFREPAGGWAGTLNQSAKLVHSVPGMGDNFGESVAISGAHVVVGASNDDGHGKAYVYTEPAGGWVGAVTQSARLESSDGTAGDRFGWSVAISGSRIVVGDWSRDETVADTGAAYLFHRPGGGWSGVVLQTAKLLAADRAANDRFGFAVAVDGDTVVAGALFDDDNGEDSGSAYVFDFTIFTDGFESGDAGAWSATVP